MLQLWLVKAFFRMDDKRWKKVRVSGTNLRTLWKEVGVKYMWLRFPGTKLILLVVEFSMGVHHRPIGAMVTYHRSSLLRGVSRYSFGSWHIRSWCIFIARIAHLPVVWFSPVSAGLFKAAAESWCMGHFWLFVNCRKRNSSKDLLRLSWLLMLYIIPGYQEDEKEESR